MEPTALRDVCFLRDRQEMNDTFFGPSVVQIWSRRSSQTGGVVVYSEDLAIEKQPKMGYNLGFRKFWLFLDDP